jgi:hypothetical protein
MHICYTPCYTPYCTPCYTPYCTPYYTLSCLSILQHHSLIVQACIMHCSPRPIYGDAIHSASRFFPPSSLSAAA